MDIVREVTTEWRRYRVIDAVHLLHRVLVWGQVLDETSGQPLAEALSAATTLRLARVKTLGNGLWCVTGQPERSFSDLSVANAVPVRIDAPGYRGVLVTVAVPANPLWPVAAGTTSLRHVPVRLQGRAVDDASGAPVAGARIVSMDPPAGPPPAERVLLVRSLLKLDHTPAATVRGRVVNLAALAPPARELEQEARRGSDVVVVNSRAGLAGGQVIRFGGATTGEFARIAAVAPQPADPALPGEITLETPMARSVPRTTPLAVFTTGGPIGPARSLTRDSEAGEGMVFVDDLPSGAVVQISEAGLPPEYHAPGGLTDADGYYAVNAVGRIARLYLGAEAAGYAAPPARQLWMVDYGQAVNVVDFRLRP